MKCPNCQTKNIGKLSATQFYCWTCFIEMTLVENKWSLNQVEEDGSLTSLNDLFDEEALKVKI